MTSKTNATQDDIRDFATHVFQQIPFNQLLGLEMVDCDREKACLRFSMRQDLVGNRSQGILHGGASASVLDTVGGLAVMASILYQEDIRDRGSMVKRIRHLGTIDMRVDYLRPGWGEHFEARASILRTGNRVAVVRMELCNEDEVMIAAGTASYSIGVPKEV